MSDAELSADDAFDVWLDTGKPAVAEVPLFSDMEALVATQRLENRIKSAKAVGHDTKALRAELDAAYDRVEASRSVWELRALTSDEEDEITRRLGGPVLPPDPTGIEAADEAAREAWLEEYRTWEERSSDAVRNLNIARIALSVVRITTPTAVRKGISEAQLQKMASKPNGRDRIAVLANAVDEITNADVQISRPM